VNLYFALIKIWVLLRFVMLNPKDKVTKKLAIKPKMVNLVKFSSLKADLLF